MWKKEFEQLLPKLGHRNWILVVDKAFPLQSAPGIVTINTGEPMRPVLGELVRMLEKASHVKPVYYTDLELNSLSDDLCPGAEQARTEIFQALQDAQVNTILHEEVFSKIDTASKLFTTVVLKTESTIPYSSVFIELDCGYWSAVNIEFGHCRMRGSVRHSHKAKSDPGGIAFAFIVFVVPIIVLKQCYETHIPDLVIFCSGTFLMRTSQYQGYPEKYPAILRNIRRHPDQEMRTKQVTPTAGSALHVRRTGSRSAEFRSSYRRRAAAPVTPGPQKRESARSAQDC